MSGCLRFVFWFWILYAIAWIIDGGWRLVLMFLGHLVVAILLLFVIVLFGLFLLELLKTILGMNDNLDIKLDESTHLANSGHRAVSKRCINMAQEEKKREEVQKIQAYRKQQAIEQARKRPGLYAAEVLQKESFHVLSPIILNFAPEFVTVTSDSKSVVYGSISPDAEVIVFECYSCWEVKRMYCGEDFCIDMFPGLISDMRFLGLSKYSTINEYVQVFLENQSSILVIEFWNQSRQNDVLLFASRASRGVFVDRFRSARRELRSGQSRRQSR
ncbi:MAG: hypothetical protein ACK4XJ_11825 [Fimbriimonadaceae bacterium]